MTNGTTALLSWLRASTSTDRTKAKTTTSGTGTTQRRNAPHRRYEVHGERTCYRCRQTGHYARECPHAYSQRPTETKAKTMKDLVKSMTMNEQSQFKRFVTRVEKLRMLIKTMTTTERSEFKAHVLRKDEQQEISTTTPSREAGPHTDPMITAIPPSRETGPRTDQPMKRLAEVLKQFRKPKPTPYLLYNNDSKGGRTRHDSKRSESNKTKPTADPLTHPTKSVTFNLLKYEPMTPKPEKSSYDAENSENDEADARLTHAAQLRKASDNVYMSNRKSMNLRAYVHAAHRRTEAPALLDSGATENFISLTYAKWLKLPIKRLPYEQPLLNVDGTTNKTGSLKFYVDLQVQTGTKRTSMRFFLTDLGHHRVILGYPWFAANQPKIDWARGWIDTTQLPLV